MTKDQLTAVVRDAIEIHEAKDPADRDTLEAWLLTGVDVEEVAKRTRMNEIVVAIYRDLFYDVAPWLQRDRDDLARAVLPADSWNGIPESDVGVWKRFVALEGGPFVLARFLDYLQALPLVIPSDLSKLSTKEIERMRDLLYARVYVLSHAPLKTLCQRMRMELVWSRADSLRK